MIRKLLIPFTAAAVVMFSAPQSVTGATTADDLPDFVTVVPSGITELAHWQLQGYALIQPQVLTKKQRNEDIR